MAPPLAVSIRVALRAQANGRCHIRTSFYPARKASAIVPDRDSVHAHGNDGAASGPVCSAAQFVSPTEAGCRDRAVHSIVTPVISAPQRARRLWVALRAKASRGGMYS
ncbi:hypothetical protein LX36DRAFT_656362 [Colletotrichum falcatum]|nr:hypothetical protein LX36DRAFT_656362 [Colletotrichum falcatum]